MPVLAESKPESQPLLGLMARPSRSEAPVALPVVSQKFEVNGREFTLTISLVDEEQLPEVAEKLVNADPQNTVLAIDGLRDPLVKKKPNIITRAKTIFAPRKIRDIPALNHSAVASDLRNKVIEKYEGVKQAINSDRPGVIFSFGYAGGMSAMTYVQTGAVTAATGQFIPSLLWGALMTLGVNKWLGFLNKSGQLAEFAASLAGHRQLTAEQREFWNMAGQFAGSVAANSVMALVTLGLTNSLSSGWLVPYYGILMNGNVLDPTLSRWQSEGKISSSAMRWILPTMQVVGALTDIAIFYGVPCSQIAMGVIVGGGFVYLFKGKSFEAKLATWRDLTKSYYQATKVSVAAYGNTAKEKMMAYGTRVKARTVSYTKAAHRRCESLLFGPGNDTPTKPPEAPFVSWASVKYSW